MGAYVLVAAGVVMLVGAVAGVIIWRRRVARQDGETPQERYRREVPNLRVRPKARGRGDGAAGGSWATSDGDG